MAEEKDTTRKILIKCPGGTGPMGGPTRPLDVDAQGFENPIEIILLLQLAQGAIQQKIADSSRVIMPPFMGPKN